MMFFWKRKGRNRVRVYDPATKTYTLIPEDELAPGMVRTHTVGIEGDIWVDVATLKKNEYQHPPFDEELRGYIRQIKAKIDEVYLQSLEEWEDGFRRDEHPEREISIWLYIADLYSRTTGEIHMDSQQKRDLIRLLVSCSTNPMETVLTVTHLDALSRRDAEIIRDRFYNGSL